MVGPHEERPAAASEERRRGGRVVVGKMGMDNIDFPVRREAVNRAEIMAPVTGREISVQLEAVPARQMQPGGFLLDGPLPEIGRGLAEGEDDIDPQRVEALAEGDYRRRRARPFPVAQQVEQA